MARTTKSLPVVTIASTGSISRVNISKTSSRSSTFSTPTESSLPVSSAGNEPDTISVYDSGGGEYTDTTTTSDNAVISTISNDESETSSAFSNVVVGATAIDTVATSATAATTTTPNHSNSNNKSGNHIQPWIIPTVYVTLSLIIVGLAMFCIRRSCSKYRRRRPLLGENNGGSMREISTNGGDGGERFDRLSSFNSEMIGDGFNSNNRSLVGSIVDSATEFPTFSGHKQGISHDITDAHADFNDDPFSDVAFAEGTSSFRNASPSPQLSQHSDITEKVEAHEPSKTETPDFAEVFVESPTIYGSSFNFYADPFQNNEYFIDDEEVEPRPMLRPSLSRIPTVISAYNELIDLTPSVNVTGDDNNNTSSSVNDTGNEIVNVPSNELSPFDSPVSVAGTDGWGEGANTECYLRSILLSSTEDLPVTGKDGEADSKSLAEELSTVLTISSAIESTALPILSTYNGGPSENVVTESRDDVGTIEQSHNNTERSRDDILNDHL